MVSALPVLPAEREEAMASLRVRELMTPMAIPVRAGDDLATLVRQMADLGVRHIPVVDDAGCLVGLVTHRDLLRRALVNPDLTLDEQRDLLGHMRVEQVMTTQVEAATPEQDVCEVARTMLQNKFGCMPVVEGRKLIGILTEGDFVRYFTCRR
jgi:CBS domain-containing membrane protein